MKNLVDYINEDLFKDDNTMKLYEKLLYGAIVQFFVDKYKLKAKISLRKKQNKKYGGDIPMNDNSVKHDKFTLHFNPNNSYSGIITMLFHEITHIKQISFGELLPSDDYKSIVWHGEVYISVKNYKKLMKNFTEYSKLPWEAEAFDNQRDKKLYQEVINSKYVKSLKGKDPTLDYIIDNL